MYIKSIKWYLYNTNFKVVFCENSGCNISDYFKSYLGNRLEILTYISVNSKDRNKGYKEMEILEYMHNNSCFITGCDKTAILVKITGRLILLNISTIIKKLNDSLYTNEAFVSAYLNGLKPWSDCRFIFFSPNFFPILIRQKEKIIKEHYFEHVTTDAVLLAKKNDIKFIYPPLAPRVDGIGGGFGNIYNITNKEYRILNLKHQFRRLFFHFGILPWAIKL